MLVTDVRCFDVHLIYSSYIDIIIHYNCSWFTIIIQQVLYRCNTASPVVVGHCPKEGDGTVQKADDKYISEQEVELLNPVWLLHHFGIQRCFFLWFFESKNVNFLLLGIVGYSNYWIRMLPGCSESLVKLGWPGYPANITTSRSLPRWGKPSCGWIPRNSPRDEAAVPLARALATLPRCRWWLERCSRNPENQNHNVGHQKCASLVQRLEYKMQ